MATAIASLVAWTWETLVTLPIKYNELTLTSAIAFTFYNLNGEPYGGKF